MNWMSNTTNDDPKFKQCNTNSDNNYHIRSHKVSVAGQGCPAYGVRGKSLFRDGIRFVRKNG